MASAPTPASNRQNTNSTLPAAAWQKFDKVDAWVVDSLIPQDDTQISTLRKNEESGLDTIDVSPNDGKLLYLLAKMNKVKRILEVGTLGGYSAIVSIIYVFLFFNTF
jgi:predicted O-methyltransferase YrrM